MPLQDNSLTCLRDAFRFSGWELSELSDVPQIAPDGPRLRGRQGPACTPSLPARGEIGRIYQVRGGPDSLRWFWSMTANGPMTRSDKVATLEEAKAQFQKSWDAWKAWTKLEETP
jgi:hypothetical protein